MNTRIGFNKMHGLGNDFVIIELKNLPKDIDIFKFAAQIADRRIGIGADQVIIFERKSDKEIVMQIYNQDGSAAEVCGNASRCMVKLLKDQYNLKEFDLIVGKRILHCQYIAEDKLSVNMGAVSFDAKWIPAQAQMIELAQKYRLNPKDLVCADIGNPHLVIFTKLSDKDKEIIGRDLQESKLFPMGINVNFVELADDQLNLRVYERGTGFTCACGSGACASFASSIKLGLLSSSANVHFKLGALDMQQIGEDVLMNGPAQYSFSGEYLYVK